MKNRRNPKRHAPWRVTNQEIVKYWCTRKSESGLSVDWYDADVRCWKCAEDVGERLQKCHIIPRALGGSDDASNLVLLCAGCHRLAPNIGNAEALWTWLYADAGCYYGDVQSKALNDAYMLLYGKLSYAEMELLLEAISRAQALVKKGESMPTDASVVVHWGDGKYNNATRAAHLNALLKWALATQPKKEMT